MKGNDGFTPLHVAVSNGQLELVRLLAITLKADVDVEERIYKLTPIHFASVIGRVSVLRVLSSECKANIEKTDIFGMTPLMISVQFGHVDLVRFLVKKK